MKNIASLLPYILVFVATLAHPLDFDLGWHLRFGKDFWLVGRMIYENTYSTEMVGYKWFNSSWLLDVIRYPFWQLTGFWGHALLGTLVPILTFFTIAKYLKLSFLQKSILFPVLAWIEYPLYLHSFRAQEVSLLFLSILIAILWKYQKTNTRLIFILIPLFFVWANIHAQFVLGIFALVIWSFVYLFLKIQKGLEKSLLFISFTVILSFLVTLINPYTIAIYNDSLVHSGNPAIQFILEFAKPVIFSQIWWNLVVWGILMLVSIIIMIKKKTLGFYLPYIIVGVPLYIISFFMGRYLWSMYILTIPILYVLIYYIKIKNNLIANMLGATIVTLSTIYVVIKILPAKQISNMSWGTYCSFMECSQKGTEILTSMKNPGRIYTDYNFGGWLIWNYPDIKPGVDGRMPLWVDSSGYSAFVRYVMLENNRNYVQLAPFDTYFIRNARPLNFQLEKLVKLKKFRLVFRDKFTSIYTRTK